MGCILGKKTRFAKSHGTKEINSYRPDRAAVARFNFARRTRMIVRKEWRIHGGRNVRSEVITRTIFKHPAQ